MSYSPNEQQAKIISSANRTLVVLGGAGTGKTTSAIATARAHLESADNELSAIRRDAMTSGRRTTLPASPRALFLSFSRTAVAQVLDRASAVIGRYGPRLEVATFDGFAWRVINHFGEHYGFPAPQTVLGSANGRVPGAPRGLTYRQLIPAATKLLSLRQVQTYYSERFGIVICDEFQDTSATEWHFLKLVAPEARRVLLGDENQCIYTFKGGIDPAARIAEALLEPDVESVILPPASYREPSQQLPAAADAARERRFNSPAIGTAVRASRLAVTSYAEGAGFDEVIRLTREARDDRLSVSIFTHTIAATTALSDVLSAAGISHEQVGFGEAYGEALPAQLELVRFALGDDAAKVRRTLAVYVTSTLGGKETSPPPPLANQILNGSNVVLERALRAVLGALRAAEDTGQIAEVVASAYSRIGTVRGQDTWIRAAHRTNAAIRLLDQGRGLDAVAAELLRTRDESLVGFVNDRKHKIQVMNLHQTKGREADVTILLLGGDEYYGKEGEPFSDNSRLLYVVMTRARERAHLVVPASPHPLWHPLVMACQRALVE